MMVHSQGGCTKLICAILFAYGDEQGVQRRMFSVVDTCVFLKFIFFALLLLRI